MIISDHYQFTNGVMVPHERGHMMYVCIYTSINRPQYVRNTIEKNWKGLHINHINR